MAVWGSCDFSQLEQFTDKIKLLEDTQIQEFCESAAKELAARLLAKVIKRTPVGDYSGDSYVTKNGKAGHRKYKTVGFTTAGGKAVSFKADTHGKQGGTLRRGWTAKTEGGGSMGAAEYAQSLPIRKIGNVYRVEIKNPIKYSSYVEFGHRTRNHAGWVEGKFMMTISEAEVSAISAAVLEKKLTKFLGDCFNGK